MKNQLSLWALSRSFILSFGAAGGFAAASGMAEDAGATSAIVRRRAIYIVTPTGANLLSAPQLLNERLIRGSIEHRRFQTSRDRNLRWTIPVETSSASCLKR